VRNGCGLAGRSGGGHRCGSAHLARSRTGDEPAADLRCDVKLATSERACPGDRITRAAVPRSFCLEEPEHPLRAVCRPRRDDPPVSFAQRLRGTHTQILPPISTPSMPRKGGEISAAAKETSPDRKQVSPIGGPAGVLAAQPAGITAISGALEHAPELTGLQQ
jgi:hypothetical protein